MSVRDGSGATAVDMLVVTQSLFQVVSTVPSHAAEVQAAVEGGELVVVTEFGTRHFRNGIANLARRVVDERDVRLQRCSCDAFWEFQLGCVKGDVCGGLVELGVVNQVLGTGVHQFGVFIVQRHAVLSYRGIEIEVT